ncbi:transmembrane protein 26-like [Saccoglossus kowalevskii]|uniref:Transmembrane protein 26-like n=1 Tax=Saccoglossus kowalevskii TaxID=10224 RepID=A0ABM0LZJ8_SACKO|nr:PREDICTED: transmembrane protein 26-like [Saccoglossus kowalevskii]
MKCLAISLIKAILTRLLFIIHAFIATWKVVDTKSDGVYWILILPSLMLVAEFFVTTIVKKGGEWKWFCPSVFLYLGTIIPCIWILEEDLLDKRLRIIADTGLPCRLIDDVYYINQTTLSELSGITIPVTLSDDSWILALQQLLMCLIILGRWLLPMGEITRDQLSQLLLVYLGMAADILEFSSESIEENSVKCDRVLVLCILMIWTWSLLQFTLVLTATKARKPRVSGLKVQNVVKPEDAEHNNDSDHACMFCETEVWSIMISIMMQDGPFLLMRLYLLFGKNAVSQMMLWFTTKNVLVIALQIYRLVVLYIEARSKKKNLSTENTVSSDKEFEADGKQDERIIGNRENDEKSSHVRLQTYVNEAYQ